ncbi:EAL domain-containing protein [Poseidonibacter lekithochrous]|uniref:EAL domain-containing response regulator n=1 Tax=Poseidonibacter lekithochrous TaxID=1904463 RepID=UPI0008FC32C8|nr:EAL domain-containing protein [Poseidonibacter lekithochrous]QKJ22684.1 response regulator receiver-modulated diguanylate cyclase/phosphodiesterase [Poseidonibacter lekithochrous]
MNLKDLLQYSKNLTVLYVEDDISKEVTAKLLEEIFAIVDIASDGLDGLSKYNEYYQTHNLFYDVVISDINMPKMNGVELSKNIFEINDKQELVIVSAYNDPRNLIDLLNIGVSSFIQKPMSFENTIKTLTKVCQDIYNSNIVKQYNENMKEQNEDLTDSNQLLEKKVSERTQDLENLLYNDKLTGLKSYYSLMKNIDDSALSIFFVVNLDSFHNINNLYGFKNSNSLLYQFAQCLNIFNSTLDYNLYRVYADEFVLFKEIDDNYYLQSYEKDLFKLISTIKEYNFTVNDRDSIDLNATIGLSIAEKNPYVSAGMALRHAKKHRLNYVIYNNTLDLSSSINDVLKWSPRLKTAIENDMILTAFQPIVDKEENVLKFEVLMRVGEKANESFNIISPYEFLEPSKKTKHYNSMMAILIEKSFITMYNRKEDFSINLSYEDIYNRTLINIIKENLTRFKKIGSRLIIEILETESIEDLEIMQKFVTEFRKFGVRIAIDDFGTGHSNFSNIIAIEPDYIKIDGSFIKNIHNDAKAYTIVKGIISASKELNIKTIAEFVHNKEVFDVLVELGIDEFQGYYFSEPLLNI